MPPTIFILVPRRNNKLVVLSRVEVINLGRLSRLGLLDAEAIQQDNNRHY